MVPITRIEGTVLGLLGFGHIPRLVAPKAKSFGMTVIAYDPYLSEEHAKRLGIEIVGLDDLLQRADFVTVHVPLTPQTRGLIGAAQLRRMKPTAYLINTARGAFIDETALCQALQEGWIAGAALDAFVTEPLPADHPLRRAPNVLLTPHQASFARETGARVFLLAGIDEVSNPRLRTERTGRHLTRRMIATLLGGRLLARAREAQDLGRVHTREEALTYRDSRAREP